MPKAKKKVNERVFQRYVIDYLVNNNGFIERTNKDFDRYTAINPNDLFDFLIETQEEKVLNLRKIFKDKFEDTLISTINNKILNTSLIETLKTGIDLINNKDYHLDLMYMKPATSYNKTLTELYKKNIFTISEEIYASDKERVDIVIFLNGIAIITLELKYNADGQNYEDAIKQYRCERNPNSRLFKFKSGALVNFAMDTEQVFMCTKLCGTSSFFMPFNKGCGEGIDTGAGNPINKNGYNVSYMWEDILTKDTLIYIISKLVFLDKDEKKDENGKIKKTETLIFPRYHQLDCLRKIMSDVKCNKTLLNYLIQHSAGSGKTYTISWLAHMLSSLHDDNDKIIYDNIIIMTDRVVVDRQLQKKVSQIEHKSGFIKVLDDECSSSDLKIALEGNTKIIATTIQKFLYISDIVKGLENKKFAVIIDEAHSSTQGKDMAAVTKSLSSNTTQNDDKDLMDIYEEDIKSHGKPQNVSMFAFTATPKATTLAFFGRRNEKGQYEAFHLYSMKQAIEEGFILNVLESFTPYETYYTVNKKILEDPKYKTNIAKRQIHRYAMLHDTNITQRIEVIVEHFRESVLKTEPWGKAMVVTGSRIEAVKYYEAFLNYCKEKGYNDMKPLIAFSGKVTDKQLGISDDEIKARTESSINGFNEKWTADRFDDDEFKVLLVANKYQTGFDQPKLCSMYVMKKLSGISAVQTLSRLNRINPPYDKKVFILDFVNSIKEIEDAFRKYYTTTLLCNEISPELIYEEEIKIDGYYVFSNDDVDRANEIYYDDKLKNIDKETKILYFLSKAKKEYEKLSDEDKKEFYFALKSFVKHYEFLLQISNFNDVNLHKKYYFIVWLLPYLKIGSYGAGFDLKGKIEITDFYQKKGKEEKREKLKSSPIVKMPTIKDFGMNEDDEMRLSEIIEEINNLTGMHYDNDVALKAALQIRDLMKKNENLVASAKTNTIQGFEDSFYNEADEALLDGLSQNQEFFTMLLNDEKIKKRILGFFVKSIYEELKK